MGWLDTSEAAEEFSAMKAKDLKVRHEMSFLRLYSAAKQAVKSKEFAKTGVGSAPYQFYGAKWCGFQAATEHGVRWKETKHLEITVALLKLTVRWVR
ncbi:hypothetical protein TROPICALSUN_76 [Erwinia phage vB_EamM_TropicalSun]|uniref:Uncharacterized protein n=1 Tax=Erwinia phage vB_EamM_TropicalSun TaxID=2591372 RepID=A0A5B9NMY2_9CAUD|nr:hypothetical protein TROPICALSUN_76 [Erwinia phage vB_EamM_TropicalSun]